MVDRRALAAALGLSTTQRVALAQTGWLCGVPLTTHCIRKYR